MAISRVKNVSDIMFEHSFTRNRLYTAEKSNGLKRRIAAEEWLDNHSSMATFGL